MSGIFVTGGASPDEIGLPCVPDDILEDAACKLAGYGPGCGVAIDRESLNHQIWSLAWVAYCAGMTPRCEHTVEGVSWLADAIKRLVCDYAYTIEDTDPPPGGVQEITQEILNPDGTITYCRTVKAEDPCPAIWLNRNSGCLFYWDKRDKQWRQPSDGHHIGPCSDYAEGLIQDCAVTWYQTDKQRTATRCGDIWITTKVGDEGCVFAPAPNPGDAVAGDIRWLAQDGSTPPDFSVMMSLNADERAALQDFSFLQDAAQGAIIPEDDVVFVALDYAGSVALDSMTVSPAQDTGFSSSWAHGSGTPAQGSVANRIYGSNDGSSWTLLPGQSVTGAGGNDQSVFFGSTNTVAYRYYGLAMDFANGSADVNVVEFRMVGSPPA